jgi:hypothetical protein
MYNIYVFQKYMYIYQLSRIHNTSLVSAYFGLNKRECQCLEYVFYLLNLFIMEKGLQKGLHLRSFSTKKKSKSCLILVRSG